MKTAHDLVIQKLHELIDMCWAARIEHARAMDIVKALAASTEEPDVLSERARQMFSIESKHCP